MRKWKLPQNVPEEWFGVCVGEQVLLSPREDLSSGVAVICVGSGGILQFLRGSCWAGGGTSKNTIVRSWDRAKGCAQPGLAQAS